MRRIGRVLFFASFLAAGSAAAVPVTWQIEFFSGATPVGTGTFGYDPATLETICPAICDDPGAPDYTPTVSVHTGLESFTAVIDGYTVPLDQIAWWNDLPAHRAGYVAYSRYDAPVAVEGMWFFGDPFFGSPHQFLMSGFTEAADGSWVGDWLLQTVTSQGGGGTWRAALVPEPSTAALVGVGLVALSAFRCRFAQRLQS